MRNRILLIFLCFIFIKFGISQDSTSAEYSEMYRTYRKTMEYEQSIGKDTMFYLLLDSFKIALDNYNSVYGFDKDYLDVAVYWGSKYADINPYESIVFFKNNIENAEENRNIKAQAINMHELGSVYFHNQQIEKAIKSYSVTSEIFKELKDWHAYAYSIIDIANVYFYNEQFNIAAEHYDRAFEVMESKFENKDNFIYGASLCYRNKGAIHFKQKNYEKALENYRKALMYKKQSKKESQYSIEYQNIANTFEYINKDSAYYYYNLAVETDEKFMLVNETFYSYLRFGLFFLRNKDYSNAEKYFRKSLELAKKNNLSAKFARSTESFGDMFYEQQKYDSAIYYYEIAYQITYENNTLLRNKNISTRLYNIYQTLEMPEKQLKYLKRAYDIEKQKNLSSVSKMQVQYEFSERLREREQAEHKEKRLSLMIIGISLIAFLLGTIAFIVFWQRRRLKHINTILEEKSIQIEKQAASLEKANEELKRLDQFKDELTSVIVHDLKNPAGAIIGLLDIVKNKDEIHEIMEKSAKQILDLVHNILDVQKYENVEMKLTTSQVNVKELVDHVLNQHKYVSIEKKLIIKNNIPDKLILTIDKDIVERIITNLLSNAIKFTHKNGVIEYGYNKEKNFLYIKDNGYGIDKEHQKIIFDRFSQVIAKRSGKVISTGLGLTFCKMAVEAHGGRIWVESEPGKGSTFYFTFS
jgi:signal transduction histidine kinase